MGSFASGFKMGGDMYDSAQESKRQKVLDDRATEQYGQQQDAYKRQLGIQAKTDAARTRIEGLDGGVFEGSQANFDINKDVAPQGPMPAEAYQAPSVGLQSRKATDREYNQAYQAEALARGDMTAAAGLRAKDRGYGVQEITDTASKTPIADIKGSLGNLNIGAMTGMPISYIGEKTDSKGKANGYNFVTYDGAGKPSPFTLNEDQLRQMHVGSQLSAAGYGAESHQVMSAVNKEAADRVKDYNDNMYKQVSSNNTGQYQSDSSEQQKAQLAESGRHNRASEGIQASHGGGGSSDKKVPPELIAEVNGLVGKLNDSRDPKEQQELRRQITNTQIKIANSQNKAFVPREDRPTAGTDPVKRLGLVKSIMEMQSVDYPTASASADAMLNPGSSAGEGDLVARLQQQDQKKNQSPRPMIVQPGENGMRPSGQAIMGDPKNFQRTNSRGLFGGISYGYVDPVTNKKYSPEEYNRLLAE